MDALFATLFPPPDRLAWLTQVQQELKDEKAYESLRWHTEEGFVMEPYYTASDLTDLPLTAIQEAQKVQPGWLSAPPYTVVNEKEANAILRDWLARGADALFLTLQQQPDVATLLHGIKLSETPVFFAIRPGTTAVDTVRFVRDLKTVAPYQMRGGLVNVPNDSLAEVVRSALDSPPFRTLCVDSRTFHNAGATATQQLAYTVALLADQYDTLTDAGLSIDQLVSRTMVSVSVGTSYFLEIAKLRALRVLFQRFIRCYTLSVAPPALYIQGQTSTFYDAAVTPYTNLLRASTEAMSAVVGGCDALTVHPYNTVLVNADANRAFAERIARNVSLLLKEESYLDKVADPSAGSYYIETLTHHLIESSWTSFLAVEERGGYQKALANGFIQHEIERAYQAKVEAVRKGKVIVGVTKYRSEETTSPNTFERMDSTLTDSEAPLPDRRLAEEFE